jgi:hypothetical protein
MSYTAADGVKGGVVSWAGPDIPSFCLADGETGTPGATSSGPARLYTAAQCSALGRAFSIEMGPALEKDVGGGMVQYLPDPNAPQIPVQHIPVEGGSGLGECIAQHSQGPVSLSFMCRNIGVPGATTKQTKEWDSWTTYDGTGYQETTYQRYDKDGTVSYSQTTEKYIDPDTGAERSWGLPDLLHSLKTNVWYQAAAAAVVALVVLKAG